ncbi:anthranilate phosphoribosyltransferase [Pokkaliibacter plantistimulans]|uniref:Anthranilate phosphoribosyltransferase n=2 Tax=Pseudomonadota TaxID=1224 RepID=A0ABX5LUP6_9GAMM|nr:MULTISPECIES: anthranilate phosphoribosyltransferase [Pokkaliibacter]MDH2431831.1 anthranilate phosphoribosyltransferase [Pokkaliibacter sp. MBI-7]PPC78969.1 anthranilate phosphoribosyltransferase [Pokkaliibacter plantistimulans]PXF30401.1 anthranilate phosphoribosyltransferase [Pokkaliibacter plantistimulans]
MNMQQAIRLVMDKQDFTTEQMQELMALIMTGEATHAQIGGFLVGLSMKGETVGEIAGAAMTMRSLATQVHVEGPHLIDTCGTGGDGAHIFNVSTASSFVVAAAGGKVAKHGNRAASSSSGSADVLEAAGLNLALRPEQVVECIDKLGVGFMFAPAHHSAMKHAIGPRREMGVRTIFNLLGPLTNPALTPNQVLGVFSHRWLRPMAEVLKQLGSSHVLVVHAADGLDEISVASDTFVAELRDGEVFEYQIRPEQFGIARSPLNELAVDNPQASLALVKAALAGEGGSATDIVRLNAGAAIYAADLVDSLQAGIDKATDVIASGAALAKLEELAKFSQSLAGK